MNVDGWRPVLEGVEAERAADIVAQIAVALASDAPDGAARDEAALTDGCPGRALFFAYLGNTSPDSAHAATARRLLDAAVDNAASVSGSQALFGGITGLAWTLQHLAVLAQPAHVASLVGIEASMHGALSAAPTRSPVELMSGLVGLGVFLLERGASADARATLERIVLWLDASAEVSAHGLSWRCRPQELHSTSRERYPLGCHYPGVAHGTAGVVGLLASLLARGVAPDATRRLLRGAVEWLVAHELPGEMALFPYQVDAESVASGSRSAWCTGGPGIALMLWRAGRAANNAEWQSRAITLARNATMRPLEEMGVRDACLCHGTAGLGLLYAHLYNETEDAFFRDESRRWFLRTFEEQRPGEGVAGYSAVNAPMNRRENAPGLLFGASGIGLALLAATTRVTPQWDRAMLMSDPA